MITDNINPESVSLANNFSAIMHDKYIETPIWPSVGTDKLEGGAFIELKTRIPISRNDKKYFYWKKFAYAMQGDDYRITTQSLNKTIDAFDHFDAICKKIISEADTIPELILIPA